MSIGNLILDVNSGTVSYLILYDSLLQNATDINTKCNSYFITKCNRSLLETASGFLLQNATVITNCDDFITKCDSYYKMQRSLQIATVHTRMCLICNFSIKPLACVVFYPDCLKRSYGVNHTVESVDKVVICYVRIMKVIII